LPSPLNRAIFRLLIFCSDGISGRLRDRDRRDAQRPRIRGGGLQAHRQGDRVGGKGRTRSGKGERNRVSVIMLFSTKI
jgi:hypothetical protein